MPHTAEIIEVKRVSNEQVSVRVRCCGDPLTDQWHTFTDQLTEEQTDTALDEYKQKVAAAHEQSQAMDTRLQSKTGLAVKHAIRGELT